MPRLVHLYSIVLLLGCSFSSDRVLAEDQSDEPPGYRSAIDQAISEFAQHNFAESRSHFARAHAIFPNARTLRGLGMAEFELRNYRECTQQLEVALRSQVRPLEGELRTQTEELLARARELVGRYTIESKPKSSELTVDGVSSSLPVDRALLLNVGDHLVELSAAGYTTEKRLLSVRGGEDEKLTIDLKKAMIGDGSAPHAPTPWYENPWVWVSAGIVVVGAATTGVVLAATSGPDKARASGGSSGVVVAGP